MEIETVLNYDEIIKRSKRIGINVTWRKLNYYKSLGLLPYSTRIPKDKRGYYPSSILADLNLYHFLQNHLGFTLSEIGGLKTKFKLPIFIVDRKYNERNLFRIWIGLTYSYFLKSVLEHGKEAIEQDGIRVMLLTNLYYKSEFIKTGISYLSEQASKGRKGGDILRKVAKEWCAKAISLIMPVMKKV